MEVAWLYKNMAQIITAFVLLTRDIILVCGTANSSDSVSFENHSDYLLEDKRYAQSNVTLLPEDTAPYIMKNTAIVNLEKQLQTWITYSNDTNPTLKSTDRTNGTVRENALFNIHRLLSRKLLVKVFGDHIKAVDHCIAKKEHELGMRNLTRGMAMYLLSSCLKMDVLRSVDELRMHGADKISVLGGWLGLERVKGSAGQLGETSASNMAHDIPSGDDDVALDYALIAALDKLSMQYSLNVEVFPGIGVRMARSSTDDAVDYSIVTLHHEDSNEEGREVGGNKKKNKKKSGKKSSKKKMAEMKKKMFLMMVPMVVQAVITPFMLLNMKIMLLKALLAGKLAIALILLNAARTAQQRTSEDTFQQDIASTHYGYGGGIEYGAWLSRRAGHIPTRSRRPWSD